MCQIGHTLQPLSILSPLPHQTAHALSGSPYQPHHPHNNKLSRSIHTQTTTQLHLHIGLMNKFLHLTLLSHPSILPFILYHRTHNLLFTSNSTCFLSFSYLFLSGDIETNLGSMPNILTMHLFDHKKYNVIYFISNTIK